MYSRGSPLHALRAPSMRLSLVASKRRTIEIARSLFAGLASRKTSRSRAQLGPTAHRSKTRPFWHFWSHASQYC